MRTQREPWENRRVKVSERRLLEAAGVDIEDAKVAPYLRNRNDYSFEGADAKRVLDAALHARAESIHDEATRVAETVKRAAHKAERVTHSWDKDGTFADAADALVAAADVLAAAEQQMRTLAAALGLRADDDAAVEAMSEFVKTYRAAQQED